MHYYCTWGCRRTVFWTRTILPFEPCVLQLSLSVLPISTEGSESTIALHVLSSKITNCAAVLLDFLRRVRAQSNCDGNNFAGVLFWVGEYTFCVCVWRGGRVLIRFLGKLRTFIVFLNVLYMHVYLAKFYHSSVFCGYSSTRQRQFSKSPRIWSFEGLKFLKF